MNEVKFLREFGWGPNFNNPSPSRPDWRNIYLGCKLDCTDCDGFTEEYTGMNSLEDFKCCIELRWTDRSYMNYCEFNAFP